MERSTSGDSFMFNFKRNVCDCNPLVRISKPLSIYERFVRKTANTKHVHCALQRTDNLYRTPRERGRMVIRMLKHVGKREKCGQWFNNMDVWVKTIIVLLMFGDRVVATTTYIHLRENNKWPWNIRTIIFDATSSRRKLVFWQQIIKETPTHFQVR